MRDSRSLLLLLVSLLLVLVSFGLIWTWGYRFYLNNDAPKPVATIVTTDSASVANNIRDSLQKIYNETLKELDNQLDSTLITSDSLKYELEIKLTEFYRLRSEITTILNNSTANANLRSAKQKINELQSKVQDFKEQNRDVETENNKLDKILTGLNANSTPTEANNIKPLAETKALPEKSSPASVTFTTSDMKISALSVNGEQEIETTSAGNTDKITGTFIVKNFISQLSYAEVFVVLTQPNGKVLKNSGWESGSFLTPEGRKIYSHKFSFNYTKGDARGLQFSVRTANLQQGNYIMEVYYNGVMIGRTVKTLSL